ncbi:MULTISPECIES: S1C family serine protease [unclassified Streptomyces]|uniref:Trypsin-like peptidase domain-containing protein n=1 Tax=Streptomyces evansiae TaxID=3075535 RepID=A0ABU2RA15_9ACTN|nr:MULTISPECIES: trypsin-like peptidase domain-containing protein [unclassified Streptomyces]EFK99323.1 periplasmic serine peptidase DegS [Streptomyces sp. SPB78]MDT0413526.1 trypsin-like peptidase domain-containing protein [Streptomyces sp. DSM 41979]MDT0421055.1 trypsin-like peptidase domain-containing protein [Streptomyces sp. DSM 41859]MYQ55952.1 PDZ domain-containing protein [Streptomyces sp. SID4926]WEH27006.1 trypsin-like peptidase domain-containing protein [Streptomyces sp. AM 3-1-1]
MNSLSARPRVLLAALCATALLTGCSAQAGTPREKTAGAPRAGLPRASSELQSDYEKVIKDVLPSVVQITAGDSLGSGIVFDDKGHVVTNAHVVGEEKSFEVTTATGEQELSADLVSSYPQQDLAVIKLSNPPKGLKAASFGDSGKAAVGQIVLAMGSPLGLSSSVTQGIVSATGRTVTEGRSGGGTGATIANMVQTSAAINPGNSGGALVDLDGKVIGIPTLAATDPGLGNSAAAGIGFAIPAATVRSIAGQIVRDGKVTNSGRAALGITGRTVLDRDLEPAGVAIASVRDNGPADKAGLRAGDILTRLGDDELTTIDSLTSLLTAERPGDRVELTYTRNGDEKTARVTLGEM